MTTNELDKIYDKILEKLVDLDFDISEVVIPFSEIFQKSSSKDIYSGTEKIPFKKRDKEYKLILKQEFL